MFANKILTRNLAAKRPRSQRQQALISAGYGGGSPIKQRRGVHGALLAIYENRID